MGRCIYYSTVLGVDLGMFYKRRDYSVVVDGRNPIIAHEFLGDNVEGKDVVIVDDMISSGESMIEVATKLKELKARRIFVCTCFGLFCNGLEAFDKAYESGLINKVFTTNLIYRTPSSSSASGMSRSTCRSTSPMLSTLLTTTPRSASFSTRRTE